MAFDKRLRSMALGVLGFAMIAGCGGSDDGGDSGSSSPPVATTPPVATVGCSFDKTVTLSYEEQRLGTPLPSTGANVVGTNSTPIADRILKDTGFDQFGTDFTNLLCPASGQTTLATYDGAIATLKTQGQALWKAAVDRAQGRRTSRNHYSEPLSR